MGIIETLEDKAGAFTARFQRYGVANKLEKRSLLIAVNAVAALSIFFFGYGKTYAHFGLTHDLLTQQLQIKALWEV